jgi:hypothetical protein
MKRVGIIADSLTYLARQQAPSGRFSGRVSHQPLDFTDSRPQPTPFYTSLIVACIHDLPGTDKLVTKASNYLLTQRNATWSWNYWQHGTAQSHRQPYPDDLDDTACALIALHFARANVIDGTVLAQFARQLIACETQPGGPYNSWLVDTATLPQWRDVDLAVNANIGYFLALQGATLPGLEQYCTNAITTGTFGSSYYIGDIPSWYFMSRWYKGPAQAQLAQLVQQALADSAWRQRPLSLALLISAGCRLGLPKIAIQLALGRLVRLHHDDHWLAEAFYGEPNEQFAGSDALTTAFAVEALHLYDGLTASRPVAKLAANPAMALAYAETTRLPGTDLRQQLRRNLRRLNRMDQDRQISGSASLAAAAFGMPTPPKMLKHLNAASLYGWLAYTIYDDFLDDEGQPAALSAAHVAQRQMLAHFRAALPDKNFADRVSDALQQVDAANTWELRHCRAVRRGDNLRLPPQLPDYGDYRQLAERSWGHSLAASGVLLASGKTDLEALEQFFRHYLIARQLNDDAHDWEEDLQHGHLSAVVCLLLKNHGTSSSMTLNEKQMEKLRLLFWNTTILSVAGLINMHIDQAKTALQSSETFQNPTSFTAWLSKLEKATQTALTERETTTQFMETFSG